MKKLLFLALLMPCLSYSQSLDSLKREILKIGARQEHISLCLQKGHEQFRYGTSTIVGGLAVAAGSILINSFDNSLKKSIKESTPGFILGGAIISAGIVVQIDSHKWNCRASRFKF